MSEQESTERATVRQVLGREVRRQRQWAGWSQRELAAKTSYDLSYISRVELGKQLPSDALTQALEKAFHTDGTLFDLLEAAREAAIQPYGRECAQKEGQAARIQACTSSLIPGLLQTEGYMRALFEVSRARRTPDWVEEAVAARVGRQRIFDRETPPLYWVVMDEAALKRPVGGRECMRGQLNHLVEAVESARLTCQIHPFEAGERPALSGSLVLLSAEDGETAAYVENFHSGELIESPKKVLELSQLFDLARVRALNQDDSLALIQKYAEGYGEHERVP